MGEYLIMNEWHPYFPDWSKEKRCIPCRMPESKVGLGKSKLSYTPVTCRGCKNIDIFPCESCEGEIGYCNVSNNPPTHELDKKKKCLWHK